MKKALVIMYIAIEVVTQKTLDVAEMLSKEHEVENKHNRRMVLQILKAIKFFGHQ